MALTELVDEIIVGTGPGPENEMIREEAQRLGYDCPCHDVPENDVLSRYVRLAGEWGADTVVRITGDCPLIDADVVDLTIDSLADRDFASNVVTRTWPRGLDTEVMPVDTLYRLDRYLEKYDPQREHVCSFVYRCPNIFSTVSVVDGDDNSDLKWCVDTWEDLERVTPLLGLGILPYEEMLDGARRIDEAFGVGTSTWGFGQTNDPDETEAGVEALESYQGWVQGEPERAIYATKAEGADE